VFKKLENNVLERAPVFGMLLTFFLFFVTFDDGESPKIK
jgi:hypothetical protein